MKRSKPWFVYIVRCRDGSLYTGIALDVEKRLKTHSSGKGSRYIRSKLPIQLIYQELVTNKSLALKREAEIKNWSHREKQDFLET